MRKHFSISSLFLSFLLLFSLQAIAAIDKQSAEIESEIFQWIMTADGEQTLKTTRSVIVHDETALENFADPRFLYDERCETIEPVSVMTITSDGRKYPAPPTAINRLTPSGFDVAPCFSHYKELICSFVGVDFGSTLQYETQRRRGTSCETARALEFRQTIGYEGPALLIHVSVSVPAEKTVFHGTARSLVTPQIVTDNEWTTLQWTFSSLPAFAEEFHRPDVADMLPVVVVSTYANWDEALRPMRKGFFSETEIPDVIISKAKQLIVEARTPEDKINALVTYVTKVFQTVNSPVFDGYIQPRPAADIYQSNVGQPWERLKLFCDLIRALGASFDIIMAGPDETVFEHVPTLLQFPLRGCLVHFEQSDWWVNLDDPTLYWHPELKHDSKILQITPGTHHFIRRPAGGPIERWTSFNVRATLEESGTMSGQLGLVSRGISDTRSQLSEDATSVLTSMIDFQGNIELKDILIQELSEKRVSIASSFTSQTTFFDLSKQHRKLTLPQSSVEQKLRKLHVPDTARRHPLLLPGPIRVRKTMTLTMSDHWRIVRLPASINVVNAAGSLSQSVKQSGQELEILSELFLKKAVYLPEDYEMVRAVLVPFQQNTFDSLILTEGE